MASKGLSFAYTSALGEIDKRLAQLRRQVLYIAEQGVIEARSQTKKDDWEDRTGNLRSSIGCCVTENGETLYSSAPVQVKDGGEGVAEGTALLDKLKGEPTRGLRIDICAGMEYASFVENRAKKNVLLTARQKVETMFTKAMERFCKK